MSRRDSRDSDSRRHRSRFDREPSPKRSRRGEKDDTVQGLHHQQQQLAAILLLAFWSMFTGSVTLKWSAGNLSRLSDDLDIPTFESMGLNDDVLRGIYHFGFQKPSAIRQRALVPIIGGHDVIAQAQSSTGKTSMIAVAVCQLVDTASREVQKSPGC